MSVTYIGLFKKRRGLQKTRTPRINALKHCRRPPFSCPEPLSLICNRRDQETTGSGDENGRPPFDESFNDSCPCSLFTPAAMAGNRPSARESRKFCQNFTSPIAGTSLSTTRLIADELFVEVSAQVSQQPSTNLDRNV